MGQLQTKMEPESQKTEIMKCTRQVINRPMSVLEENESIFRMIMHGMGC